MKSSDGELSLVQGCLTELHVERGRQNLMQKIDKHYRDTSALAGLALAASDLFGQSTNALALALYDGEDTQKFACLIDGRIVCGQFAGAEFLKVGNTVKAVVVKRGEVLSAQAILDEAQGYLWIGHPWGSRAELVSNLKLALFGTAFAAVCMTTALTLLGSGNWSFREAAGWSIAGAGSICLLVALWSGRDMRGLADPSTQMFRLLGFADPAGINLNRYRVSIVHMLDREPSPSGVPFVNLATYQTHEVFCYKRAIEKGDLSVAN